MTSLSLPKKTLLLFSMGLLALSCSGAKEEAPFIEPTRLSETGLYSDFASRTLAPGVRAYQPRYELWSDGAGKSRWLQLPEGTQIDTSDMDHWVFPVGTKAWKAFSREGRLVETRILWKVKEGEDGWFHMAFVWNEAQTEATAVPDGQANANGTPHDVPAQKTCASCHDGVRDVLISPSAVQLSAEGGQGALTEWANDGLLSDPPSGEFEVPGDATVKAALGYLHANCSHCHNDEDRLAEKRVMRLNVRTTDTEPAHTGPYRTTFNVKAFHLHEGTSHLIVPGDADASQIVSRAGTRDATNVNESFGFQMPPTCTEEKDVEGIATLRAWIDQL